MLNVGEAKLNGKNCAAAGMNSEANPYRNYPISEENTKLYEAWDEGWNEAHIESSESTE